MSLIETARPIREYQGIDRTRFEAEVRPAAQPAVLRGLAAGWPAVAAARQSPEALFGYLQGFGATRDVSVIAGDAAIGGRFFYTPDLRALNFRRGRLPLAAVLGRLLQERTAPAPSAIATQSEALRELLPGFAEANRIDLVDAQTAPRAWIGNRIRVATHYDLQENIGCVVAGRRRFLLFPPDQFANMYVGPIELTPAGTPVSLVDPLAPDLARFPRFADAMATAQVALLEPGDAIYIPFAWWHAVDSLDAINLFVNYWWNDAPPGVGSEYDALLHALYALRNRPRDQRAAWSRMFDHYVFRLDTDAAAHLPEDARGMLGPLTPSLLGRMRATLKGVLERL